MFQRELYRRLNVDEVKYEPFYTMAWIGVFVCCIVIALKLSERSTWGRAGAAAAAMAAIVGLVILARQIGWKTCLDSGVPLEVCLKIRLGNREREILQRKGVDTTDLVHIEEYCYRVVAKEWQYKDERETERNHCDRLVPADEKNP